MDLLLPIAVVVLGLILLAGGGEALVRAATSLAQLAGVTPAVIGLTVVAIGTSLPELVVSLLAAIDGQPDLAVANVVGSNIFNIAAALGITALVFPLPVHGNAVRLEWPFMFAVSLVALLVSRDGRLDRLEGGAFVLGLVLFIAYTVHLARREVSGREARELAETVEARDIDTPAPARSRRAIGIPLAVLAVGNIALVAAGASSSMAPCRWRGWRGSASG